MKKLFLMAAVAALVACSDTDNIKDTDEAAIDFTEVFIEKSTKAPYASVANLQSDTRGFGVFGAKTKQDNTKDKVIGKSQSELNGGAQVTYSSNDAKWTYSPKRYWDKGATKYEFYAYAPYNKATTVGNETTYLLGTVSWNENQGENGFSISGFKQNTTVADMVDILTDLENQKNNTQFTNNVSFSFKHILSNINFYMAVSPDLKADENDNPVSVNSVTVGAVKMDGSYAYVTDAYKWTLAASPTTHTFQATQESNKVFAQRVLKAMKNTTGNTLSNEQISSTPTAVPGLTNLLFVPQTLPTDTKYVVTIQYLIGDEVFDKTIELNEFSKIVNETTVKTTEWVSGYQYNYILVIGPTPIEFDVTGISDWSQNSDTYEYVIE